MVWKNSKKHRRVGKLHKEELRNERKDDRMFVGEGGTRALR